MDNQPKNQPAGDENRPQASADQHAQGQQQNNERQPAGQSGGVQASGASGAGSGYGGSAAARPEGAGDTDSARPNGSGTAPAESNSSSANRRESESGRRGMQGAGAMSGTQSNSRDENPTDGNATGQRM